MASGPTTTGPVAPVSSYAVPRVSGRRPALVGGVVGTSAVALALAVTAPMATIVLGLVFFGMLAATLSSRYLVGRFAALLDPAFVRLLGTLITGVVVCGLLSRVVGRPAELVATALGYGVLAVAVRQWSGARRRVVAWALLAAALALSLAYPAYHLVVLGQLLLLAPLGFLWEWSRGLLDTGARRGFRGALLLGYVGVPVLLLGGALDPWLTTAPGQVRSVVGNGEAILRVTTLPGTEGTPLVPRMLALSAFLGTLAYAVWLAFFPCAAHGCDRGRRGATAVGDRPTSVGGRLHGRRRPRGRLRARLRARDGGARCRERLPGAPGPGPARRAGRLWWPIRWSRKGLATRSGVDVRSINRTRREVVREVISSGTCEVAAR